MRLLHRTSKNDMSGARVWVRMVSLNSWPPLVTGLIVSRTCLQLAVWPLRESGTNR